MKTLPSWRSQALARDRELNRQFAVQILIWTVITLSIPPIGALSTFFI